MPNNSYRQIFKSTTLIGGTQVIKILIGVFRTKILALLLGPSGMAVTGMYQSATALIGTVAGFGIRNAGVRQIAEAVGTGDENRINRTVKTVRLTSLIFGLFGMLVTFLFSKQISHATFGNDSYGREIALISMTLLFEEISAGQMALLQGMRRLRELSYCQILGTAFGTAVSIALVYFLNERGIAPYLVTMSAFGILSSWWYTRKVRIKAVKITIQQLKTEFRQLLKMGFAFMFGGVLATATDYTIRILITRQLGMNAVGLYTATWTLSSLYVGMILNAMGADFYPRLTALASNDTAVNQLVNEQIEMGVLIAVPGILATITLAPWVLRAFYSEAFVSAATVIQWQILGVGLRVVSSPMSFVQFGKGMAKLLILTETVFAILNISLLVFCMKTWGLEGVGISFLSAYGLYSILMFFVCNRLTGFRFSKNSLILIVSATFGIAALFAIVRTLPIERGIIWGLMFSGVVTLGCLFKLQRLLKLDIWRFIPSVHP